MMNYSGQESLKKKFKNAVYDSDIFVILKQGQGQQIWYGLVGPTQGYNHAKFEKLHFSRKSQL